MTDKRLYKSRVRKLEQKKPQEYGPTKINWTEYDPNNPLENQEPPPGETWIIWGTNDKIYTKRGKPIK